MNEPALRARPGSRSASKDPSLEDNRVEAGADRRTDLLAAFGAAGRPSVTIVVDRSDRASSHHFQSSWLPMKVRLLTQGAPEWASFLNDTKYDFYHLPAYAGLSAVQEGGEARALLVVDDERSLLLPLIIRPVPGGHYDATSPYGYPGPLVIGTQDPAFMSDALVAGMGTLGSLGIVSVFVRLHPELNPSPPEGVGTIVEHGDTVLIDLSLSAADLWGQTRHNHRRAINKAKRRGYKARIDEGWAHYRAFERLYRATMRRRSAPSYYFFDDSYFDRLREVLGDSMSLCVVEVDDVIVAAGLFVETSGMVEYHLSGSDEAYAHDGPTKLMIDFIRTWAKHRGNTSLHLGGGVGGAFDSLLQFKLGFSPIRRAFRTVRIVVLEQEYARLVAARDPSLDPNMSEEFFPLYRDPFDRGRKPTTEPRQAVWSPSTRYPQPDGIHRPRIGAPIEPYGGREEPPEHAPKDQGSGPVPVSSSQFRARIPAGKPGSSPEQSGLQNVLVTAAGRRTSLVAAFGAEVRRRGGRLFAGDVDPLAPALFLADEAIQMRATTDSDYVADLKEKVERLEIRLIVPTIDPELAILARSRAALKSLGCVAAVSAESFIAIASDKLATATLFGDRGVAVPRSWSPEQRINLPEAVFVKPRRGSASQGAGVVATRDLDRTLLDTDDPIIQEVLSGPEITIDALLDFEGQPVHYVPRRRVRTLAGESIQGVTLDHDRAFESWIENLLEICGSLGAAGPLCLQAFLTERGPVLNEINARFGGGFPLGLAAGGLYPAWLLDLIEGIAVPSRLGDYEPGLYMTRYNVEYFTRSPKW